MYPLAVLTVSFAASYFPYNTYHTSPTVRAFRGSKAGVSPPPRSPPCKDMSKYVDHVVSAVEKSDLDQLLEPSTRLLEMRSTIRRGVCRRASQSSSLPTLLGMASAVLASSPCGGCSFFFLSKYPSCLVVRFDTYNSGMYSFKTTGGQRVACTHLGCEIGGSIPRVLAFFF